MEQQHQWQGCGKLEALEEQAQKLLQESKDYYYTEYLQKLLVQIRNQKYQTDLLQDELERSYQLYLQRISVASIQNMDDTSNNPAQSTACPEQNPYNEEPKCFAVGPDSKANAPSKRNDIPYQAVAPEPKKNAEFTVGIVVFSIIGVAFLLTSFVMLGMNFMNGLVKGISLYGISLLLIGISEAVITKKSDKMAMAFTSLGVGGLYLSTIINYIHLHNFNGLIAMLLTGIITTATVILSRRKNSWLLRVIGMIACYLSFIPVWDGILPNEFLVITAIIFGINLLCILLPLYQNIMALGVTQIISNAFFSQLFLIRASWCGVEGNYLTIFAIVSFIVLELVYWRVFHYGEGETEKGQQFDYSGIIAAFCVGAVFQLLQLAISIHWYQNYRNWLLLGSILVLTTVMLVFYFLTRKSQEKWLQYYFWNIYAFVLFSIIGSSLEKVICIVIMLVLAKLLMFVKPLKISEAIITALACLLTLFHYDQSYFCVLLAACLICIPCIYRWQTYYEILLTSTLAILAVMKLPSLIKLPAAVGIFLAGILLFHQIKRFRDSRIKAFYYVALAGQVLCYLALNNRIYTRAYITYVMMLVFGLGTIVLTFQEEYGMNNRKKPFILSLFLTYMAFICRLGIPVMTSILLMVIALFSVGTGFVIKEKNIRIYGLVLSLFVCGKVILYDFMGVPSLQRMILFFVVGLIALIISGIYILLEKKENQAQKQNYGGNG